MSIHDTNPIPNRKVPQDTTNLSIQDAVLDTELMERLRLAFGGDLSLASPGIVAETNPATIDATDASQPLTVQLDPNHANQVLVYPGRAVTSSGHRIVLTATQSSIIQNLSVVGSQTIIYLLYQNEEIDEKPVPNRIGNVYSRLSTVDEAALVQSSTKTVYEALDSVTKKRSVPLALITIQALDDGTTEPVIDLTAGTAAYLRPWFSVVDVVHRKQIGSGIPSATNPHGMTGNDIAVAGSLSLYQALIGHGVIIAPAASRGGVPGTLCTETIPSSRFVVDTTGAVTGVVNAKYVDLVGYPIALGSCVKIDGNEDSASSIALAMRMVQGKDSDDFPTRGRTAVAYVDPLEVVEDGATYELRYTSAKILEPPVNFITDTEIVFGSPVGDEAVITDGLAYHDLVNLTLNTAELGPIARRVYIVYNAEGITTIPQVIVPFTRLSTMSGHLDISQAFRGPGRLRVWLTDAVSGSGLNVSFTLTGTDANGDALTESITFDSTWADNPVPAEFEVASQAIELTNVFASMTGIDIDVEENDGPNSAIIIDLMPEGIYNTSTINFPFPVAYAHWDGYHFHRMTDARDITISLREIGGSRAGHIAESVLTHHAIWPDTNVLISHILSDDSDSLCHSNLRSVNKWSARGEFGADTPASLSNSAPSGDNEKYVSRALRPTEGAKWLMVMLHGTPHGISVEYRYTKTSDPGSWSAFLPMDASAVVAQDRAPSSTSVAFFKFLPDLTPDFTIDDTIFKFQVRILGDWKGLSIFAAVDDPHTMTFDFLVQALDTVFAIQHWGPGTTTQGQHKEISIVPVVGGSVKLLIERHESDVTGTVQLQIQGRDGSSTIDALLLTAAGTLSLYKDLNVGQDANVVRNMYIGGNAAITGDVTIAGDADITGNVTGGNIHTQSQFKYDNDQEVYIPIPLTDIATQMFLGQIAITSDASWTSILVSGGGLVSYVLASAINVAYPEAMAIRMSDPSWSMFIDINPYARADTLKRVELVVCGEGAVVDITIQMSLQSLLQNSTPVSWTTSTTDSDTYDGDPVGTRQTLMFDVDQTLTPYSGLDEILAFMYRLKFTQTAGSVGVLIFRMTLIFEVGSVEHAVNIALPA